MTQTTDMPTVTLKVSPEELELLRDGLAALVLKGRRDEVFHLFANHGVFTLLTMPEPTPEEDR